MAASKKSDDINRNYPLLGFRVTKTERDLVLKEFEDAIDLLRDQPQYRRLNLKKNAVFIRALEIGIEQIKKRKSLG